MEYRDSYEGHTLRAWTAPAAGGWTWVYSVDEGSIVKSEGTPHAPESMVLGEGIGQARRAVRHLMEHVHRWANGWVADLTT